MELAYRWSRPRAVRCHDGRVAPSRAKADSRSSPGQSRLWPREFLVSGVMVDTMAAYIHSPPSPGIRQIAPTELARSAHIRRIVDVREPEEFSGKLGHIAGAELVPLAVLESCSSRWQ